MFKQLLLTTTLAASALFSTSAADYTVYNNGTLGQGIVDYPWWNATTNFEAANPDGEGKVFEFKAEDGGKAASMGLFYNGEMTTGPFHSATLNFSWYATGTGNYDIRLTVYEGIEQNYRLSVKDDDLNKWHELHLEVATTYPELAKAWKNFQGGGTGYLFGVSLTEGAEGAKIYFSNIYYSNLDESWTKPDVAELPAPTTVPTPTLPAADVISIYGSAYPQATTFGIGGWSQSTKATSTLIDGKDVLKLENFNYLGWVDFNLDVSGMTHVHVDYWTPDGSIFKVAPISLDPTVDALWTAPSVEKEVWNSYDIPLSYSPNLNLAHIQQFKFDVQGAGNCTGYITNVYFYNDGSQGGEDPKPEQPGNGKTFNGKVEDSVDQQKTPQDTEIVAHPYTMTYSVTWNEDKTLTVNASFEWANGEPWGIIEGELLVNGVSTKLIKVNDNFSATTAATYNDKEVLNMQIHRAFGNGDLFVPFQYTVGSESEGEGGGDDPTPGPEPVEGATYSGTVSGTDVIAAGTKEYPYTLDYSITYNSDKTLTIEGKYNWTNEAPIGLVAGSAFIEGTGHTDFTVTDGVRKCTTTATFEPGQQITVRFYIPRDSGVCTTDIPYTVGSTNQGLPNSINEISARSAVEVIYDLQGRRLAAPVRGLNIINGRKVYVK